MEMASAWLLSGPDGGWWHGNDPHPFDL